MMNSHFTQAIHYVRKCNAEEAAKLKTQTQAVLKTESSVASTTTTSSGLRSLFRKLRSQGDHHKDNAVEAPLSPASHEREQNKAMWHRQLVMSQSLHARALPRR
jgi:hypothetical protein